MKSVIRTIRLSIEPNSRRKAAIVAAMLVLALIGFMAPREKENRTFALSIQSTDTVGTTAGTNSIFHTRVNDVPKLQHQSAITHRMPVALAEKPHGSISPSPVGDSKTVRDTAVKYRTGRYNAFFNGREFLAKALESGSLGVDSLKEQLLDTGELEALPTDIKYMSEKPAAIMERMALIDTMEGLSKEDPSALDSMIEIALEHIDSDLPEHVKRALVAEKYDVFVALARTDWLAAKDAFLKLDNHTLQDLLRPALIGGLVDSGIPRDQAVVAVGRI